jgi:hypothetical protein
MSTKKAGGFYWERSVYQSEAFLSLGINAMKFLIALFDARIFEKQSRATDRKGVKRKPKCLNLDSLEMPYSILEKKYNMNQQGIVRSKDELLAKGFIKIIHEGGLGEHDKARYALIDDYLKWKLGMKPFRLRNRDVRRGYQGRGLGAVKNKTRSQNVRVLHTSKCETYDEPSLTECETNTQGRKSKTANNYIKGNKL